MSTKRGFIDRLIELLPEMHVSGYHYCGPNTNLAARLACGDIGVNELDCACMEHDIAYAESSDLNLRCNADKLLILRAFRRMYANDSKIGERFTAMLVSGLIGVKLFLCKIELCISSVQKRLKIKKR